jgi:serine/threonine-protein kinase
MVSRPDSIPQGSESELPSTSVDRGNQSATPAPLRSTEPDGAEPHGELPTTSFAGVEASDSGDPTRDLLRTVSYYNPTDEGTTASGTGQGPLPDYRAHGYEVQGILGRGGMGVVYKAYQPRLGRYVALKTLPPAFAADPTRLIRFKKEVMLAARLKNSRILKILHEFEADGVPVVVMEFVDGPDLAKIIRARHAEREQEASGSRSARTQPGDQKYLKAMFPILDQLVAAVASLHEAGIIHRDIKPSNVLVDTSGNVWLSDFGLARELEDAGVSRTGAGAEIGTHGYMSPEAWEGRTDLDRRTDVFGLGVTLYKALALELPYGRKRITAREPLPAPPSMHTGLLTPDEDAVVLKAIEADRSLRFESAVPLQKEWQSVRSGLGTAIRRLGPMRRFSRRLRRHPVAVANLTVLALCLGSLALAFALAPPNAFDAQGRRQVTIETRPPGARFAVAKLNSLDGIPSERPAAAGSTTPARVRLAAGDYLVVVQWPNGQFHEVYRRVPEPGEGHRPFRHHDWTEDSWKAITLPAIDAPPVGIEKEMAYIEGSSWFDPPPDPMAQGSLRGGPVPAFYLDRSEVTNAAYARAVGYPPVRPQSDAMAASGEAEHAARYVDFGRALHAAERMGKRLPEDLEFLFAATNGGRDRFPWGSEAPPSWVGAAEFGPVGGFAHDRTRSDRPILGLFSNVLEWTLTRPSAELPTAPRTTPGTEDFLRVVRGGPHAVSEGERVTSEYEPGAAIRILLPRDDVFKPGVGFRCARSARPRYLAPARP